jgi:hypothetical protein
MKSFLCSGIGFALRDGEVGHAFLPTRLFLNPDDAYVLVNET